jgi:glucokinase
VTYQPLPINEATAVVSTATGPSSTGPLLVGVDVGGTKIAVLITSPDGTILGRATAASSAGDQDGAAEAIATTIETALDDARASVSNIAVIGVGVRSCGCTPVWTSTERSWECGWRTRGSGCRWRSSFCTTT